MNELPLFIPIGDVRAAKIRDITRDSTIPLGGRNAWRIAFEDPSIPTVEVSGAWVAENKPQNGGYIVQAESGVMTFAFAGQFESTFAAAEQKPMRRPRISR